MLYGTGFRAAAKVSARVGGQAADRLGFAAQPDYPGVDQANVRIPRALAGKGEAVVELTADGRRANAVNITFAEPSSIGSPGGRGVRRGLSLRRLRGHADCRPSVPTP